MLTETYKNLGLISIVVLIVGQAYLLRRWKGNKSMSLSLHAAQYKSSRLYYGFLFSIYLPIFYVFIEKWFIPTLGLGKVFNILAITALALQFITAWVPQTHGWKATIHLLTAYGMAVLLMPLTYLIANAPNTSSSAAVIGNAALAVMLTLWAVFIFYKNARESYLIYQTSYVACFILAVLSATYL